MKTTAIEQLEIVRSTGSEATPATRFTHDRVGDRPLAISPKEVLLLIRHAGTRNATARLLQDAGWTCTTLASLSDLRSVTQGASAPPVALLDWSMLDGLLLDEHRAEYAALVAQQPLVLLVPQNWLRFLTPQQTLSASLLPKPFEVNELFQALAVARVNHAAMDTLAPQEDGASDRLEQPA